MRTEKVKCDGCGADLTVRTNIEDYRLVLASESKPGYGAGVYTCMGAYPPVERAHHFCGLDCLDLWSDRRRLRAKLRGERLDQWREEHGTRKDGRIFSWPGPPRDVSATWDSEAHAAALAAFPFKQDASAIEAGTAEGAALGAKRESAAPQGETPG
jgi:hypothetical protein